jgi:hypothetical protein
MAGPSAAAQGAFQQALRYPAPAPGPALDAYVRGLASAVILGGPGAGAVTETDGPEAGDEGVLPDRGLTPGLVAEHSAATVCRDGYSSERRHRDPRAVARLFASYGVEGSPRDYEDDHLVPIKLGGDPTDPRNQWPQPRFAARWNAGLKDRLEWRLITWVCDGGTEGADRRLAQAQADIKSNWIAAYAKYCPADSDCPGYGRD